MTLILQIPFVVKIDNRLHYVSLTSSVKQAYKRKQERDGILAPPGIQIGLNENNNNSESHNGEVKTLPFVTLIFVGVFLNDRKNEING